MKTLIETNDIVVLSLVQSVLEEEGLEFILLDQHMSVLEGSIGAIRRRIGVPDEQLLAAREILITAGLGKELPDLDK